MRKYGLLLLIFLIPVIKIEAQNNQVWMLGPMLHFNFSEKKISTSFGIELAYWNYDKIPYSFDGGIEFGKGKFRLYSEAQTGVGFLGVSVGPVLEYQRAESRWKVGAQGSLWANYFGGIDLRYRLVGGVSTISPGLYFKLPLGVEGGDADGDSDDWDWDD